MIQLRDDQSLLTLGHKSKDDAIPLQHHHHFSPFEECPFEAHQACHGSIQTLLKKEAWLTHQQLDHQYSHTRAL